MKTDEDHRRSPLIYGNRRVVATIWRHARSADLRPPQAPLPKLIKTINWKCIMRVGQLFAVSMLSVTALACVLGAPAIGAKRPLAAVEYSSIDRAQGRIAVDRERDRIEH
ncbi:hypothetical protein [Bradyrhizobium sp. SZCCHNR2028]|uniref:hypothetical protein n=2 Tax=unclassified Bradyrhizobium TaxID=2631580 RepID=UPI0028EACBF6|nr:hypothetical protein [Bradyrhizobium sp. SZCCHNR2028]